MVDTWAFSDKDVMEFMSMEHSRPNFMKLLPEPGDTLFSNQRRPIMTLTEDTSGGIHDTLMAACDNPGYELLGCKEYHDNCTDNLSEAMEELGLEVAETPSPLNLFMNIPWTPEGKENRERPTSKFWIQSELELPFLVSAIVEKSGQLIIMIPYFTYGSNMSADQMRQRLEWSTHV